MWLMPKEASKTSRSGNSCGMWFSFKRSAIHWCSRNDSCNQQVLIWDWWDTFVEPSKLMKVKSSYNWKRNSRQLPRRVRNYKFSQSYLKVGPGSGYRVSLLIAAIIFGASMYCWSLKGESHCTGESHATTVSRSGILLVSFCTSHIS